jgi:hypothetical protein
MKPVDKYCDLIRKYHEVIKLPGPEWCEPVKELVREMDKIYPRLTDPEIERVKELMHDLYEKQIS